jgi:hypothetical protein
MKISIEEAYKILDLEDHNDFQNKRISNSIEQIRSGEDISLSEGMFLKECFLYMRQTGRTTYKCVDAAVRLLNGEDIMYITHNISNSKRVKEIIKNYTWTLGLEYKADYLSVGKLEVAGATNFERIKTATRGWSGSIIIDIY